MAHVRLNDVHFSYPVFEVAGRSLKVTLMGQLAGGTINKSGGFVEVDALQDITFELKEGDRLGLIGHNGSGKSTLLRLVAGLAHPKSGRVDIAGRIIPLIDKGMGINPELSGYANIELPLRLLGASTREIARAKEEIPEWTGLGSFIDLPFRTYSEGMKARLAFALCTALQADILVLDEWLAAGDLGFIERAQVRLTRYLDSAEILVLASHSNDLIKNVCNVVMWMERGRMVMLGDPSSVIDAYVRSMAPVDIAAE